jgi:hypothetical protein
LATTSPDDNSPTAADDAVQVAHNTQLDEIRVPAATTTICSFWAIEACCRGGLASRRALERARMLMEQSLSFCNHLGMYAEGMDLRGGFIGPYPAAVTHVALVRAAIHLDRALNNNKPVIMETPLFAPGPTTGSKYTPHEVQTSGAVMH